MPRIDGVFQLLPGIYGEPDTTIKSVPYNSQLDDFVNEMNGARPITAGGTGATSASQARTNLGVPTGTSGAVLPFLNAANTWSAQQTMTALLNANANITIDNSNPRIFFNDTNDGGLTTVGPYSNGQTFRIEIDEAGAIANSAFQIRIDTASRFSLTSSLATFSTALSVTNTIDSTGTVTITNAAPVLQLTDTSITNLAHMVRSFGDHLVLDADVNNVQASSQIQFRIDGSISAGVTAANQIYALAGYKFGDSNSNDWIEFSDVDNTFGFIADSATTSASIVIGGIKSELPTDGTANAYLISGGSKAFARNTTGTATQMGFVNPNGVVGSVSTNGTATTYNTSSDYRLKYDLAPLDGSGAFIDALRPYRGKWVADDSDFVGFVAHEFAEVSPSSVAGEKDAMVDIGVAWKEDENGQVPDDVRYARSDVEIGDVPDGWQWEKTGERPHYQSMQASTSEVMANVIAELQSLRVRVGVLEH